MSVIYAKNQNLVTRRVVDQTVVVPVTNHVASLDSIYTLNEVGTTVWNLIDGCTTADQIVDAVVQEYETTVEEASRDVTGFLNKLTAAGLIHQSGGPAHVRP